MATQRRAGLIQFKVAGVMQDALGNFTYNLGRPMREAIVGSDGVHGHMEKPQVAFIEGEITDRGTLDLSALVSVDGESVTLSLGNGKVIILGEAWFAGEGTGNSETGAIAVRFEGKSAEEAA